MNKKDALSVGVIVARFQMDELHRGHKWLVEEVMSRHMKTLIVLGCSGTLVRTKKDPLHYSERKIMVEKTFPNAPGLNIKPLDDHPFSHTIWSEQLDTLIRNEYPGLEPVIYGARDSIADPNCKYPYTGSFKKALLDSPFKMSGTEFRRAIEFPHTRDARAAIIYDQQYRYNYMFSTADLAIWDRRKDMVLLTGKNAHSGKLAFMGGHVEKADRNAYDTAVREGGEEIKGIELSTLTLLGNATIDDPRYRGTGDGVLTNFYVASYLRGEPIAADDVDYVEWVRPSDLIEKLVPWHAGLGQMFIEYRQGERRKAA
jgi:bifunctional NMN adenylyltransferase/nudix hydrolase